MATRRSFGTLACYVRATLAVKFERTTGGTNAGVQECVPYFEVAVNGQEKRERYDRMGMYIIVFYDFEVYGLGNIFEWNVGCEKLPGEY